MAELAAERRDPKSTVWSRLHVLLLEHTTELQAARLHTHLQRVARTGAPLPLVAGLSSSPLSGARAQVAAILTFTLAPPSPGSAWIARSEDALDHVAASVARHARAAAALDLVLRRTEGCCDTPLAVALESATYSTLLAGADFAQWRAARPRRQLHTAPEPVTLHREGDVVRIELADPDTRNAWSAGMRDGYLAALDLARLDPSVAQVVVEGRGPAFCAGGHLDEFGTSAPDTSHLTRLMSHAGLATHQVADRLTTRVHGACVGAGIEVFAFGAHLTATNDAWFQLPELSMGLIPGAGGTISVPRRIGRQRTAWMALSGDRIEAREAASWGLVDEIDDRS